MKHICQKHKTGSKTTCRMNRDRTFIQDAGAASGGDGEQHVFVLGWGALEGHDEEECGIKETYKNLQWLSKFKCCPRRRRRMTLTSCPSHTRSPWAAATTRQ
eukprot:1158105-Pelagomonas_calceolata.AAC.8